MKYNPDPLPRPSDFYCSNSSQEVNESLLGTAPHVNTWFMLEHKGKWGHKALTESDIPDSVKNHFNNYLDIDPLSRLLLIKQNELFHDSGSAFFVALANQPHPTLYKFHFKRYEDLLDFDLLSLSSGDAKYATQLSVNPLYLICTNGIRDQCCAKFGLPAYSGLAKKFGPHVWKSSHQGGHRFAPNMLCLPQGLCYGHASSANAALIVRKYRRAEIHLPNLRGRASYPQHVQAAEGHLRAKIGDISISSLSFSGLIKHSDQEWTVNFASSDGLSSHLVRIAKRLTGPRVFSSCVGDKYIELSYYDLLDHSNL